MITQEQFEAIAAYMGVTPNTISQWRSRGYVPPTREMDFMEAAQLLKFEVTRYEMRNLKQLPYAERVA